MVRTGSHSEAHSEHCLQQQESHLPSGLIMHSSAKLL